MALRAASFLLGEYHDHGREQMCPTALLPYCPTALLPYCPYCPTALLPYCPAYAPTSLSLLSNTPSTRPSS
jgi:hypothetical protein